VIASSGDAAASGEGAATVATTGTSQATNTNSAVVASAGGVASGIGSGVFADQDGEAAALQGHVIGSNSCKVSATSAGVIASEGTENNVNYSLAGGRTATATPSTANMTWRIESISGDIYSDGTVGAGAADYAECFELKDPGTALPPGSLVALQRKRAHLASEWDTVLGVVSAGRSVVGNAAPLAWEGRYLRDEWGQPIWEDVEVARVPATSPREAFDGTFAELEGSAPDDAFVSWGGILGRSGFVGLAKEAIAAAGGALPPDAFVAYHAQGLGRVRMTWGKLKETFPSVSIPDGAIVTWEAKEGREAYSGTVAEGGLDGSRLPPDARVRFDAVEGRDRYVGPRSEYPGDLPADAIVETVRTQKQNPDFDPDPARTYVPRTQRPDEWAIVGLLGQLPTRISKEAASILKQAEPGEEVYLRPGATPGVGEATGDRTRLRALELVADYDAEKGYAIAWVLVDRG